MRIPIISGIIDAVRELVFVAEDFAALRRRNQQAQADRDNPITLDDPVLGRFTFSREGRWFHQRRTWCGADVELSLNAEWDVPPPPADAPPDLAEAAALAVVARQFCDDEAGWLKRLKDVAVRDLYAQACDWQEEAGPLGEAQFRARITPTSLSANGHSDFEIWFDDGDLFWGHGVMVYGTWAEGPQGAEMHG